MSSEIEVPLEGLQEHIHHEATHNDGGDNGSAHTMSSRSVMLGALVSAFLAVFAAICALLAGHASDEAMIRQIESSDQWSFYQAKGIKLSISEMKTFVTEDIEDLKASIHPKSAGAPSDASVATTRKAELQQTIDRYHQEQDQIKEVAKEKELESKRQLAVHEKFAMAVTFFQVGIALVAISILTKKWQILYLTGVFGLIGLYFMTFAMLAMNSK